jgi:O-antigen/teichoic acid export membrane protein
MSDYINFEKNTDLENRVASRRQERRERRATRRADTESGGLGWLAGLVLIAIGTLYLLSDFDILPELTNWWALFMLLPGIGTLSAALGAYRRNGGHWTPAVTGPFLAGLLFVGVTFVFLFELNYSWLWPLFLIAAGLLLLFRPYLGHHAQ